METYYEPEGKATEEEYINSYRYTQSQRIAGFVAVCVVLCFVVLGITTLIMSIINLITN